MTKRSLHTPRQSTRRNLLDTKELVWNATHAYKFELYGATMEGTDTYDYFGSAVAISGNGNRVAVGSDGKYGYNGAVIVYEHDDTLGSFTQFGPTIRDELNGGFASSLDLSHDGNTLVVGAPYGHTNMGCVTVYKFDAVWKKMGDEIVGHIKSAHAGHSVSISGDGSTIAYGSPYALGGFGNIRVMTFDSSKNTWNLDFSLDGTEKTFLGGSISLNFAGDRLVAGARLMTPVIGGKPYDYAGGFEVFDLINRSWKKNGKTIHGDQSYGRLGHAIDMSYDGKRIVAGAFTSHEGTGAVYVFQEDQTDDNGWSILGQVIKGEEEHDQLGSAVSISGTGSIIAIGAPDNNDISPNGGEVKIYRFDKSENLWKEVEMNISGYDMGDDNKNFGDTIGLSEHGDHMIIGSQMGDYYKGVVQIYKAVRSTRHKQKTPFHINKLNGSDITSMSIGALFIITVTMLLGLRMHKREKTEKTKESRSENILKYIDESFEDSKGAKHTVHVRKNSTAGVQAVYALSDQYKKASALADSWRLQDDFSIRPRTAPASRHSSHTSRSTRTVDDDIFEIYGEVQMYGSDDHQLSTMSMGSSRSLVSRQELARSDSRRQQFRARSGLDLLEEEEDLSIAESQPQRNDDDSRLSYESDLPSQKSKPKSKYYTKWYGDDESTTGKIV